MVLISYVSTIGFQRRANSIQVKEEFENDPEFLTQYSVKTSKAEA